MIGGVDGYKWNITDSYDNNLNQRNNVNNKDELGQKGAVDKSKTTECQTCKNRKYVDGSSDSSDSDYYEQPTGDGNGYEANY